MHRAVSLSRLGPFVFGQVSRGARRSGTHPADSFPFARPQAGRHHRNHGVEHVQGEPTELSKRLSATVARSQWSLGLLAACGQSTRLTLNVCAALASARRSTWNAGMRSWARLPCATRSTRASSPSSWCVAVPSMLLAGAPSANCALLLASSQTPRTFALISRRAPFPVFRSPPEAEPHLKRTASPSPPARNGPSTQVWIANHAEDKIILVDFDLVPVVLKMMPQLTTVKHVIVMTGESYQSQQTGRAAGKSSRVGRPRQRVQTPSTCLLRTRPRSPAQTASTCRSCQEPSGSSATRSFYPRRISGATSGWTWTKTRHVRGASEERASLPRAASSALQIAQQGPDGDCVSFVLLSRRLRVCASPAEPPATPRHDPRACRTAIST